MLSRKGQSQIIQFLMFFMIGLAVFLLIGTTFRDRLDFFADDIGETNRKLMNSYFSSIVVNGMITCKECDNYTTSVRLLNMTAGSFTKVNLNDTHLTLSSPPATGEHSSTVHGLLSDISTKLGSGISSRPIVISYSKIQSILEVNP